MAGFLMTSWIVINEKVTEKHKPINAPKGFFMTGICSSIAEAAL
jgi:hypothetical protein